MSALTIAINEFDSGGSSEFGEYYCYS